MTFATSSGIPTRPKGTVSPYAASDSLVRRPPAYPGRIDLRGRDPVDADAELAQLERQALDHAD